MSSKEQRKTAAKKNPDNLYQRNGVWWIRYNAGGRKVRLSLKTKSLTKAKELRNQILAKRTAAAKFGIEEAVPRKDYRFSDIVDKWRRSRQADVGVRRRTLERAETALTRWIEPWFGAMSIHAITFDIVERFVAHLRSTNSKRTKRPLARATVAGIYQILRQIFRWAIKRELFVGVNPCEQLDRPPTMGPGRDVVLREDEAARLLEQLTGPLYFKVAIGLSTGLRWGEIHGLAWDDLELEHEPYTLTVCRSFRGEPKNDASAATIPISDDGATLLRRWRQESGSKSPYVFPDENGELHERTSSVETKAIKVAAKSGGIKKNITPHVFRHTYGTWLYDRTRDLRQVQSLLRHAKLQSTMVYVHDTGKLSTAVNMLPKLSRPRMQLV